MSYLVDYNVFSLTAKSLEFISPLDLLHWLFHLLFITRTLPIMVETVAMVKVVFVIQREAMVVVIEI